MTLSNVRVFQEKYVKNKTFTYCTLGDTKDLDIDALKEIEPVTILTQEEILVVENPVFRIGLLIIAGKLNLSTLVELWQG